MVNMLIVIYYTMVNMLIIIYYTMVNMLIVIYYIHYGKHAHCYLLYTLW